MDLGIAGRHALICASSRGLGRACAFALAEAGCSVVVNGRDEAKLEETAEQLREATSVEVTAVAGDVTEAEVRERLVAVAPVDILVNNAAGPPLAKFTDLSTEAIHSGVDANMVTPIAMIQLVIDGMVERKFGRIINITSSSVVAAIEGLDLSSGARAGLTGFLGGVSRQVAHANVAINNCYPAASTPIGRMRLSRSLLNGWARLSRKSAPHAMQPIPPGGLVRLKNSERCAPSWRANMQALSWGRTC